MARVKTFDELLAMRYSRKEIAAMRAQARKQATAITLRQLREMAGLTQEQAAKLADKTQSQLSKFERDEDHKISTLREYVRAMGGEVKVIAELNGKTVELAGF